MAVLLLLLLLARIFIFMNLWSIALHNTSRRGEHGMACRVAKYFTQNENNSVCDVYALHSTLPRSDKDHIWKCGSLLVYLFIYAQHLIDVHEKEQSMKHTITSKFIVLTPASRSHPAESRPMYCIYTYKMREWISEQ